MRPITSMIYHEAASPLFTENQSVASSDCVEESCSCNCDDFHKVVPAVAVKTIDS
jgi:hypothetical protein